MNGRAEAGAIPNTPPRPFTAVSTDNPTEAARLWSETVSAGRVVAFFLGGKYQGTTANNNLDKWLSS